LSDGEQVAGVIDQGIAGHSLRGAMVEVGKPFFGQGAITMTSN